MMSDKLKEEEYKKKLTPTEYNITRQCGTEPPFKNEYYNCHKQGTYLCKCCDAVLFSSADKFDSGSGWPSFTRPLAQVQELPDTRHGMTRTEVKCSRCGAHLGHKFDDGPRASTGMRYCVNSASLKLQEK